MKGVLFSFGEKKRLIPVVLLVLIGVSPLLAITIDLSPPVFEGNNSSIVDQLNSEADKMFSDLKKELESELGTIDVNPQKLIGAFADSSVFSSFGATQRTYLGYKTFAFTLGTMVGAQLPVSPLNILDEMENLEENLNRDRDIKLG